MAWQQTPFTIPLAVATVISLLIGAVAWRHRGRTGAQPLAALMAASAWWAVTYLTAISSTDPAIQVAASKLMYVGIGGVPVAWLVFAAEYTGRLGWLTRRRIGLLLVVPTISVVLVLTNEVHGLIWDTVVTTTQSGLVVTSVTYGAWFWVHVVYLYLLLAAGTLLILRMVAVSPTVYRGQAIALVVAVLIPWGANALYLGGVTGVWDPTNIGIVFSGALLLVAIFRHQLLDLVPAAREVARDEIIDSMTEAVIVVNRRDTVVDINSAAEAIIDRSAAETVGTPLDELFQEVASLPVPLDGASPQRAQITRPVYGEERTFDVRVSPLRRGYGAITGRLITLRDVTERIRREERIEHQRQLLAVVNRVLRHDIRNEMNLVLALAEKLQSDHPEDETVDRILQKGRDVVDLSERARHLEQVAGTGGDARQVVDIVGVVDREVADLIQSYPASEVEVTSPDRARVLANGLIDSAIGNLLENAIKHNDRSEPSIAVRVDRPEAGGSFVVEIADDGPGLPARERAVIETGAETALEHSSGLGLWLAYWIVTKSGGEIAFSENEPRGTVITVELQAAEADEAGT